MTPDRSLARKLMPWLLITILLVLMAMVVYQFQVVRGELAGQVRRELEQDIRDRTESWESELVDRLVQWSEVVATDRYQPQLFQAQWRREPWFDSIYLWSPAMRVTEAGRSSTYRGRLVFPRPPRVESSEAIQQIQCLTQARRFASLLTTTVDEAVTAWRVNCRNHDASTRMVALSEAVTVLARHHRWEDVLDVLDSDGPPPQLTLREAAANNIPPYRVAILGLQRAESLRQLGRDDEATALEFRLGMEIADLDGPDAQHVLGIARYVLDTRLAQHGTRQHRQMLNDAVQRAARRVFGLQEVQEELLGRVVPGYAEPPRFIRDQYGDKPFLLFTHWALDGEYGVAIQLDEEALLRDFLQHLGRLREHVVVTDSSGSRLIAGARVGGPVTLSVPFSRTLDHLRVGLRADIVDARLARVDGQRVPGLALLLVLFLIAVGTVWSMMQASRQQRLLLARQREFATRVTHELKTPLAGIKVMAENLELGAYEDDRDRASMARSIVREADNLTQRVNEILSVTRERVLRAPERFDPEEPLFEVIEQWGPRVEVAGARLEADLEPTDEVLGDPEAFRDAVACLLDNAIKYQRPDADDAQIALSLTQVDGRVRVTVEDNGIGVPASMRDAIFERFVRVEGDHRGRAGGHGLGLAQVAQIAAAHGGRAWCEEAPAGGARFVIEVPPAPP